MAWGSAAFLKSVWGATGWSTPTPAAASADTGWVEITSAHTTSSLTAGAAGALGITLSYLGAGSGWQISGTPAALTANGILDASRLYLDSLGFTIEPGDQVFFRFEQVSVGGGGGSGMLGIYLNDASDASSGRTAGISLAPQNATQVRGYANDSSTAVTTGLCTASDINQARGAIFTSPNVMTGSWIDIHLTSSTASQATARNTSPSPNQLNSTIYPFLLVGTRAAGGIADTMATRIYIRRIRPDWATLSAWTKVTDAEATGSLTAGSAGALGATLVYSSGSDEWQLSGTPAAVIADGAGEGSYLDIDNLGTTQGPGDVWLTMWQGTSTSASSWMLGAGAEVTTTSATKADTAAGFRQAGGSTEPVAWVANDIGDDAGLTGGGTPTTWHGAYYADRNFVSTMSGYDTDGTGNIRYGTVSGGTAVNAVQPRLYVCTINNGAVAGTAAGRLYMQRILAAADWS